MNNDLIVRWLKNDKMAALKFATPLIFPSPATVGMLE